MRIRLDLSYVGTRYSGWQKQPNRLTVQGVLEETLSQLFSSPVAVTGAGRTDTGVHARHQVAHFDAPKSRPSADELVRILNRLLPPDLSILRSREVSDRFHARRSARRREYLYRLLISPIPDPYRLPYVWYYPLGRELSMSLMKRSAASWTGTRNFSRFSAHLADGGRGPRAIRNMERIEIQIHKDEIRFRFVADAFLYRMVRRMVAYLVARGSGKRIRRPDYTAPAQGLHLERVRYR